MRQNDIREAIFQAPGDAGMQKPAPAAQQGAVGGILHKCVLKDVARLRWRASDEQQAGILEPIECFTDLRFRQIGDGSKQLVPELAANRSAGLCHFLGSRPQPIQPRYQR